MSGTILALFFGVTLAWFPPTSIIPSGSGPLSDPKLLVLPVLTLCIAGSAYIIRMLRAGMAEAMASDYVQAARLNGIPESRVVTRHALRNSLAPTVQVVALTVQWLVGGIVVVETVFSYPGLGQGLVQAVTARDIPVVQSLTLLIAAFYLIVNLVADIVVILLVPKLQDVAMSVLEVEASPRPRRRRVRFLRSWSARVSIVVVLLLILLALIGPALAPHSPTALIGPPYAGPSSTSPLGTDYAGEDVLSRVLAGGRTVILYGALATLLGVS